MHPMPLKTILLLHNIFSPAAEKKGQLTCQNTKGCKNTHDIKAGQQNQVNK